MKSYQIHPIPQYFVLQQFSTNFTPNQHIEANILVHKISVYIIICEKRKLITKNWLYDMNLTIREILLL